MLPVLVRSSLCEFKSKSRAHVHFASLAIRCFPLCLFFFLLLRLLLLLLTKVLLRHGMELGCRVRNIDTRNNSSTFGVCGGGTLSLLSAVHC